MFKTFLFDFDYTLIDASDGIVKSVNYALLKNGFPACGNKEIEDTVGLLIEDIFKILAKGAEDSRIESMCRDFSLKADEVMAPGTVFYGDTLRVLSALKKKNMNVGIVTSKTRKMVYDVINPRGYGNLVDFVVGCDTVASPKPAADGILMCMNHFGCSREEILYTGDSETDALTAKNACVAFAGVTTGRTKAGKLLSFPNFTVQPSLTELYGYVFGERP